MGFANALTVDLEDWYQGIEQPYDTWGRFENRLHIGVDRLLDILEHTGAKATFFVLGWIAEKHPDVLKRIAAQGHEIASHGYNHEKLYDMTPDSFKSFLDRARKVTQDVTGQPVRGHRAPYFTLTRRSLWAIDGLRDMGFTFDSSVYPGPNWRYGIPGSPEHPYLLAGTDIVEFPVCVFKVGPRKVGVGGAYFRILPLAITQNGIRQINANRRPAMLYIHPWELDPGHPLVRFRWRAMLTHYFNLAATAPRLSKLLAADKFTTMSSVIEQVRAGGPLPVVQLK